MPWESESREQLLAKIAEGLESADDTVRAAWEQMVARRELISPASRKLGFPELHTIA